MVIIRPKPLYEQVYITTNIAIKYVYVRTA